MEAEGRGWRRKTRPSLGAVISASAQHQDRTAPENGELVVVESTGDVAVDARKFVVAVCVARIAATVSRERAPPPA